jgi:hypothetical protein
MVVSVEEEGEAAAVEAEAAVEEVEGGEEEGVGKAWGNGVDVAVDIKIPLSVAMQLV